MSSAHKKPWLVLSLMTAALLAAYVESLGGGEHTC